MSTESTSRLSSKALATEDADHSPDRKAGQPSAASEVLSATAHRITAPRPRPISAFASVTLNNSYGIFQKHQNNTNTIQAGTSIFTISYNKPSDEFVTLVTLP
jgi:hypothetical protein